MSDSDYDSPSDTEVDRIIDATTSTNNDYNGNNQYQQSTDNTIDELNLDLDAKPPSKPLPVKSSNIHPSRQSRVSTTTAAASNHTNPSNTQPINKTTSTYNNNDTNTNAKRTISNDTTQQPEIKKTKRKAFDNRSSEQIRAAQPDTIIQIPEYTTAADNGYSSTNNIPLGKKHAYDGNQPHNRYESQQVTTESSLCGLSTQLQLITDNDHQLLLQQQLLNYFYSDQQRVSQRRYRSLPGPLPISFARKHIQQLINNEYYVCEKSDGERAILYINSAEQCAYIVDRKFQFRRFTDSTFYCRLCAHGDTVVDGEILALPNDNDVSKTSDNIVTQSTHVFMMFDCMVVDGTNVSQLKLSERLRSMVRHVVEPYNQFIVQSTYHNYSVTPLQLKVKFMVGKKYFNELRKLVVESSTAPGHYIFTRIDSKGQRQQNGNDGFIFTPENDSYMQSTINGLLKWKWPGMNTVDMRIVSPFYNDNGELNLYTQANTLDYNHNTSDRASDVLMRSTAVSNESQQKLNQLLGNSSDAIIEFSYNSKTGEWIPHNRRTDKNSPNFITTVISTLETIIDNVTINELESTCKIPTPKQTIPQHNHSIHTAGIQHRHAVQQQNNNDLGLDDYQLQLPAYMQQPPTQQQQQPTQNGADQLVLHGPILRDAPVWNFEPTTDLNSITYEHQSSIDHILSQPTSPYIEYQRSIELMKLRRLFNELCRDYLHINAPRECFNRWLYLQYAQTTHYCIQHADRYKHKDELYIDPLLRAPTLIIDTDVIKNELRASIPSRNDISRLKIPKKAHQTFNTYTQQMYQWLTKSQYITQQYYTQRDHVLRQLQHTQQWYNQHKNEQDVQTLVHKFVELRDIAQPLVMQIMQPHIMNVCQLLYNGTIQSVHTIQQLLQHESRHHNTPHISVQFNNNEVMVQCHDDRFNDTITIQHIHYDKLHTLYQLQQHHSNDFHTKLYLLIRRYSSVFDGIEAYEGSAMHAAVPESSFQQLTDNFTITQELFASPLNCYYKQFCSAFIDTDYYFGSYGSFFDCVIVGGSYECNPPFVLEVMNNVANKLIDLLSNTQQPLSIVIYVPYWNSPPAEYITKLSTTTYLQYHCIINDSQHQYVQGQQHQGTTDTRYFKAAHDTALYIIQNNAGTIKYPVTEHKVRAVLDAQK